MLKENHQNPITEHWFCELRITQQEKQNKQFRPGVLRIDSCRARRHKVQEDDLISEYTEALRKERGRSAPSPKALGL